MTARQAQACATDDSKSGNIVRLPSPRLTQIDGFADAARELVWQCFPGDSAHQKALAAAQWSRREGHAVSAQTFRRILNRETEHIDARLLFDLLFRFQDRHGTAFPIGGGLCISVTRVCQ